MIKVLVTDLEYDKSPGIFAAAAEHGVECLRAPGEENALAAAVRDHGASHVIVGVARYIGPLYDALPAGGVIARYGVGHDGIDKERATTRGLYCVNTPGVLDDSVAEMTLALLLAAARHVERHAEAVRSGEWSPSLGAELRDKTLAVIGCGAIGCRVAAKATFGFSMNVVGCKRDLAEVESLQVRYGFARIENDFAQVVEDADYVSLHIPSTVQTRHFIDCERLALMPKRTWLINTARGAVVDESALYDALSAGFLGGAALDVFEYEPYQPVTPDKDLRTLSNVIMTPHIGSSTREACARMAARALENVQLAEAGRPHEMDLLNLAVLDAREANES
jgi:lactate dehydrogenase-like 2-hydroxyacid dehydrogenase